MRIDYLVENFEDNLKALKKTQARIDVLQRAFSGFDDRYNTTYRAEEGAYHYIPVDLGDYIDNLLDLVECLRQDPAYKAKGTYVNPIDPDDKGPGFRPISFVEVGCGLARNLFVTMHGSGIPLKEARGFDISPHYIEQARRFFFLENHVEVGDALTYDYTRFDVVYFARPFHDEKLERKFEKRMISQLRPGAYVMCYLPAMLCESNELVQRDVFGRLWQKKVPEKARNGKANGQAANGKTSRNTRKTTRPASKTTRS